ncbi:Ferm, Arhgef And Pleckstrin Domain-Containing Protein 1 [Manis pentadactyla]|nr:Ferm, Arhgef And Pleckstrin Domain-Containing Protein 1 [Manis pentadactyla]
MGAREGKGGGDFQRQIIGEGDRRRESRPEGAGNPTAFVVPAPRRPPSGLVRASCVCGNDCLRAISLQLISPR